MLELGVRKKDLEGHITYYMIQENGKREIILPTKVQVPFFKDTITFRVSGTRKTYIKKSRVNVLKLNEIATLFLTRNVYNLSRPGILISTEEDVIRKIKDVFDELQSSCTENVDILYRYASYEYDFWKHNESITEHLYISRSKYIHIEYKTLFEAIDYISYAINTNSVIEPYFTFQDTFFVILRKYSRHSYRIYFYVRVLVNLYTLLRKYRVFIDYQNPEKFLFCTDERTFNLRIMLEMKQI